MIRIKTTKANRLVTWLTLIAVLVLPVSAFSQTKITYHSNKYKPADDVKVGRQAAAEVEQLGVNVVPDETAPRCLGLFVVRIRLLHACTVRHRRTHQTIDGVQHALE